MIRGDPPQHRCGLVVSLRSPHQMISIFALAYALSSPILTALTGRVDRRKLLLAAMTIFSLANVVAASTHTYWGLAVARVLLACAAGFVHAERERARRRPRPFSR